MSLTALLDTLAISSSVRSDTHKSAASCAENAKQIDLSHSEGLQRICRVKKKESK